MSHPAVSDVAVQGFKVPGVGALPRAYIVLKNGYEATAEEIELFVAARVADTDRLRGGMVFVDKLAKDPNGKLIVNLDKWDRMAEMVDKEFIKHQPKVKVSQMPHAQEAAIFTAVMVLVRWANLHVNLHPVHLR